MNFPISLYKQDMTQGQFLSGVKQIRIQNFTYSGPVAIPKLKSSVYLVILPIDEGRIVSKKY